jgi:hypothetical protein
MTAHEEVRVIALSREYGYWLTPEGEAALDAALRTEPTQPISRAVADEARELARQRGSKQIDGAPPTLL